MIYVMGQSGSGIVKIGTANSPAARLRAIQAGHPYPLAVLFQADGGRDVEKFLHETFASLRMSEREWFDFGDRDPVGAVAVALEQHTPAGLNPSQAPTTSRIGHGFKWPADRPGPYMDGY